MAFVQVIAKGQLMIRVFSFVLVGIVLVSAFGVTTAQAYDEQKCLAWAKGAVFIDPVLLCSSYSSATRITKTSDRLKACMSASSQNKSIIISRHKAFKDKCSDDKCSDEASVHLQAAKNANKSALHRCYLLKFF